MKLVGINLLAFFMLIKCSNSNVLRKSGVSEYVKVVCPITQKWCVRIRKSGVHTRNITTINITIL